MNQAVDRNLARRWFELSMGGNIDMIRQLVIQNPGIVNIYSRDGTALTIACQQFSNLDARNNLYYDIIDLLLGAGANPNLPNDEDMLPIMILLNGVENAERREMQMYDDVFELLKEHGMNVNAFTEQGETALMFACNSNAMRSVRYLVENLGADVNAEQRPYATALLYATNTGSVEMVEYLIQHGAVPNRIITHFVQSGEFDNKPAIKELLLRASAAAAAPAARPAPAAAAVVEEEEEKMDPEEKARKNQWFAAVKEGKKKNIQNMIKNDINVNMTNDKGNTALIYAILREKYEIANLLLQNGKDPNIAIPEAGKTPLMLALLKLSNINPNVGSGGLTLLIGNLIKQSNLDTQDVNGDTALHYAVQLKQEKIVQMLLNKGANPNVKNDFGNTPLMMICTHKDTGSQEDKILDHLLKDPRTDKTTRSNDGLTPLMYAIFSNNIKFVTKLLRAGLDPNIISNESLSSLMLSINKDPKIIEALLRVRDINVNQKGPGGDTALFMAIRNKKVGIARLLLEHGADPTIGADNGEVPLEYIISQRDYPNKMLLVELMLQHGADPNTISRISNNSVLLGAVLSNNIPLVELLIRSGANVNQSNPAGLTPLMGAAHIGSVQLITLLLKAGADANAKTENSLSALIYAMANQNNPNRFEAVSALLEADPPIQLDDQLQKKRTALLVATEYNLTDVLLLLLTAGANPNYRTDTGLSALDMAITRNSMEQINMLIDHGAKPTARIQDMVDERKIQNPDIRILLHERFHMVPRLEVWSGWSQSDVEHFDSVFLKDVAPEKEKEAIRERNNNIVCPICLRYVSRESGCMYMYHNCKDMGGFYHKELYDKYKGQWHRYLLYHLW
jgi:ankyrin repeat protein